jgi:hypothetical protein
MLEIFARLNYYPVVSLLFSNENIEKFKYWYLTTRMYDQVKIETKKRSH